MPDGTTFAAVDAGVRAAIAAYTLAMDDGRTDDVIATFCADGSADLPGLGTPSGHVELRAAYSRVEPRVPQRHLVLNTLITAWDDSTVSATSDVVFLILVDGKWRVQLIGRYDDVLRREADGQWRFSRRAATFLP